MARKKGRETAGEERGLSMVRGQGLGVRSTSKERSKYGRLPSPARGGRSTYLKAVASQVRDGASDLNKQT